MSSLQTPVPLHPPRSTRSVLLRERHLLFAAVALLACGCSAAGLLGGPIMVPLALGAILLAMAHGAYDQVQAEPLLRPRLGRRWLPAFLAGYALLAGLTALGWWLFPLASLLLFLGYSAWHFGTEPELWTPGPLAAVAAVALGAIPVAAACRWHPLEVEAILRPMLGGTAAAVGDAHQIAVVGAALCGPLFLLAVAGILFGLFGRGPEVKAQLCSMAVLQAALFRFCDPFVAFAVFFCFLHTPEHMVATSMPKEPGDTLRGRLRQNLRVGFLPWLLSVAAAAAVFLLGRHEAALYRSEIFILLSALTVPHMALNELDRMPRKENALVL